MAHFKPGESYINQEKLNFSVKFMVVFLPKVVVVLTSFTGTMQGGLFFSFVELLFEISPMLLHF